MLAQGKLLRNVLIMNMDTQLESISESMYGKEIALLNAEQIYIVVVCMVKGLVDTFIRTIGEKKFYYISTAFEKGKFLEFCPITDGQNYLEKLIHSGWVEYDENTNKISLHLI